MKQRSNDDARTDRKHCSARSRFKSRVPVYELLYSRALFQSSSYIRLLATCGLLISRALVSSRFSGHCLNLHPFGRPSPSVHTPQLGCSPLASLLFSICRRIVRSAASVSGECPPLTAHCRAFFPTHFASPIDNAFSFIVSATCTYCCPYTPTPACSLCI
ncbi:hypothetical protein BOTBODRAFT_449873 [Botryobasidium botryosum FD-172 SS1]|uniref:Uncharacterized protein n=1 Tax=Botryobasidium botryosum (strain FD-172 SS1) TaxID=930990 RepID=A0A067MAI6_BOTB1|nr:hypothetical protein BOTBODRAFT_449873 [Botryobasidium botryosum FD-172 SS1]